MLFPAGGNTQAERNFDNTQFFIDSFGNASRYLHTKKMQAVVFRKICISHSQPGYLREKKEQRQQRDSTAFTAVSGKKKVYIAIGDEETIVANLWEKYRDLSYLCRWGRKKTKQICQEEELGISKLWLSIDNIKKLENIVKKRWENQNDLTGKMAANIFVF